MYLTLTFSRNSNIVLPLLYVSLALNSKRFAMETFASTILFPLRVMVFFDIFYYYHIIILLHWSRLEKLKMEVIHETCYWSKLEGRENGANG